MRYASFLALAVLLSCASASAQYVGTDAEIRPNYHDDAASDGAVELKHMTACILKRNTGYAKTLLKAAPGSDEENKAMSLVNRIAPECLGNLAPALTVSSKQYRGAAAEELYLGEHVAKPEFSGLDHRWLPLPENWPSDKISEGQKLLRFQHEFANCIVSKDPDNVDALLRTDPQTKGENKVVKALMPSLGPCLQNGVTFTIDAAMLRALTAEAIYRSLSAWEPTSPTILEARN